jgi:hypothetical protein
MFLKKNAFNRTEVIKAMEKSRVDAKGAAARNAEAELIGLLV